jgi:hypothetical protein
MGNMTLNMISMWICTWRKMWMNCMALIKTAMPTWTGIETTKRRKMKKRQLMRSRIRMERWMGMRMMAKNLGRLARERV